VKTASDYDPRSAKCHRDVGCPAETVGLHSSQADQYPLSRPAVQAGDSVQRDLDRGLRHHGAAVTDNKAFGVVLRRPDPGKPEKAKDKSPGGLHTGLSILNPGFSLFRILAAFNCTPNGFR
jgi:hypothetical protein